MQPHRWQPPRLPRPWDSPGKNTGVGCHFLLQCMKMKSERDRSVVSDSSRPHGLQPTRLLRPWDFPGKCTGVGCHCLLRLTRLPPPKRVDSDYSLQIYLALEQRLANCFCTGPYTRGTVAYILGIYYHLSQLNSAIADWKQL